MKTWDRAAKAQLRGEVMISGQQYDFILRKSARDTMFVLVCLKCSWRSTEKELHCVFEDPQKAYDSGPGKAEIGRTCAEEG